MSVAICSSVFRLAHSGLFWLLWPNRKLTWAPSSYLSWRALQYRFGKLSATTDGCEVAIDKLGDGGGGVWVYHGLLREDLISTLLEKNSLRLIESIYRVYRRSIYLRGHTKTSHWFYITSIVSVVIIWTRDDLRQFVIFAWQRALTSDPSWSGSDDPKVPR